MWLKSFFWCKYFRKVIFQGKMCPSETIFRSASDIFRRDPTVGKCREMSGNVGNHVGKCLEMSGNVGDASGGGPYTGGGM